MVLLHTQYYVDHLSAARPSSKLRNKYMGPYKVIKVFSPVSYKLLIPAGIKIHPVIHVSQLKRYVSTSKYTSKPAQLPPEIVEGHQEFEVEKIFDKRIRYKRAEYLVKWVGYGEEDNSWLPHWKLDNSGELIREFEKRDGKRKQSP